MRKQFLFSLILICRSGAFAHPIGNFSVSHYAKLQVTGRGIEVQYALDLAEIPTFELLRSWGLERTAPRAEIDRRDGQQARERLKNLTLTSHGRPAKARYETAG